MSPLFIYHIPYCSTPSVYASKESFSSILYQIPFVYYFNGLNVDLEGEIALLTFKGTEEFKNETIAARYWWKYLKGL
jgi:hypothetical protein